MEQKRKDGVLKRILQLVVVCLAAILLVACGEKSQEDIVEAVHKTWANSNYELNASMEVKTKDQSKVYNVEVWHTLPDFYRVEVHEADEQNTQIIIKNEEGVFLISPETQKMYKFQTDWPNKNSQSYLIGAIAEDLIADKAAAMKEVEGNYVFDASTRNAERTGLPTQQIVIDKKTMLPEKVSLLNESQSEQIVITFDTINLKAKHKPDEYGVEQYQTTTNETSSTESNAEGFKVHYPTVQLENTELVDELVERTQGNERAVLSFKGDKSYTIVQQPVNRSEKMVT